MFTSEEPTVQRAHSAGQTADRPPSSLADPLFVAAEIWKKRFLIALMAILGAGAAVFIALATPKIYMASTQLILDPRGLNLVQNEVTQTPLGLASDAALALIQSQIAVITSTSVLERVVDEAGLTQDPEFNGTAEGPFDRYIPSIAFLSFGEEEEAVVDRRLLTLQNLRRKVSASRNANSFVIDVTARSESPEKAARLSNLIAEIFIEEQGRVQSETARRAATALSTSLVELRQRVGEAEEAVERYKAENGLVGVGGRLIDDEFILRINNQLAAVRSEITTLNVRAESMRQTSVDDVVEGAFPEELSSQSLVRLRQTFAEVAQENAVLASRLGPRHPQRIASEQSLASARRAIATELSRIVAAAQTELARARDTERDLTAQIEQLRGRQIETSESFVGLRELERDVDASRAIYEALLLRSREIGQQEGLNTANVRVISPADPPLQPSGLSRKFVVAGGGIAGLVLGFGLALMLALWRLLRMRLVAAEPAVAAAPVYPPLTALPPPPPRTPEQTRDDEGAASREEPIIAGAPATGDARDHPEGHSSEDEAADDPRMAGDDAPATDDEPSADEDELADTDAQERGEERRERLRQRIREIGARRRVGSPPLDDGHASEAIRRLSRSDRPTIADIRRRRRQNEDDTV